MAAPWSRAGSPKGGSAPPDGRPAPILPNDVGLSPSGGTERA